jgi:hypothetical protein
MGDEICDPGVLQPEALTTPLSCDSNQAPRADPSEYYVHLMSGTLEEYCAWVGWQSLPIC